VHRSCPSVSQSVSLSVNLCLSPKCKKAIFSKTEQLRAIRCLLTTYRKLCKLNSAFQRTHYWIPTIQDGWDPPSWKSTWRHFLSVEGGPIWIKFRRLVYRMTCRLRWCVEMETRCRIPIWRTFGRIHWHVITQPCVTLQGAATWWIHCHDSRATCHTAGCSHLTKSMSWSCHIAGCNDPPYWKLFFAIFYFCFVFNAVN